MSVTLTPIIRKCSTLLLLPLALLIGLEILAAPAQAQAPKLPTQGPGPGTQSSQPASGPVTFAPKRGYKPGFNWKLWGAVGGGAAVVLILIVAVAKKNKQNDEAAPSLASGVLGGYRLDKLMMTGQSSQVWEIVELSSHRHFAMKLLLPEKVNDPEHRELLFHEADVG